MDRSYAQGFIDKCAERGVDPDRLIKLAQDPSLLSTLLGNSGIQDTASTYIADKAQKLYQLMKMLGLVNKDKQGPQALR